MALLGSNEEFSIMQGERRQEADFLPQYQRLLAPKAMNPSSCLLAAEHEDRLIGRFFSPLLFSISLKKRILAFLNLTFQSLTVPVLRKYFLRFN